MTIPTIRERAARKETAAFTNPLNPGDLCALLFNNTIYQPLFPDNIEYFKYLIPIYPRYSNNTDGGTLAQPKNPYQVKTFSKTTENSRSEHMQTFLYLLVTKSTITNIRTPFPIIELGAQMYLFSASQVPPSETPPRRVWPLGES
ncbi:hypothetical protein [Corynebacterium lowii]|uniref:hypothetical protein n=1 Tax=Corynebacterium lowii TaxID=1544413 RepID=UPI0012E2C506|nr:hypothetical protein [Corynebacterium lowii]